MLCITPGPRASPRSPTRLVGSCAATGYLYDSAMSEQAVNRRRRCNSRRRGCFCLMAPNHFDPHTCHCGRKWILSHTFAGIAPTCGDCALLKAHPAHAEHPGHFVDVD